MPVILNNIYVYNLYWPTSCPKQATNLPQHKGKLVDFKKFDNRFLQTCKILRCLLFGLDIAGINRYVVEKKTDILALSLAIICKKTDFPANLPRLLLYIFVLLHKSTG